MSLLPICAWLSVEVVKSALFHCLWLSNYWCWWHEWCRFASCSCRICKKSIIVLIAHILSVLAPNLCQIICWGDEICPLWWPLSLRLSMLMTWMVHNREVLMQEMWKKSTIALIAHRLSELAPHLCQIISQGGEICPIWRPLTQSLAMLMTWIVQIRKVLMQEIWIKWTIALIPHILSELTPYQCWLIYCIYVLYFHYREDTTILDGSIPRVSNYKNVKVLKKFCLGFHNLAEKILS